MSQLRLQAAMTHMQRNYKHTALAFGINIVWSGTALHIHLYLPRTGVETQRDTHTVNCTGIPTAQIITWLLHLLEGVIHLDLHNSSFSTKPHSIIILNNNNIANTMQRSLILGGTANLKKEREIQYLHRWDHFPC